MTKLVKHIREARADRVAAKRLAQASWRRSGVELQEAVNRAVLALHERAEARERLAELDRPEGIPEIGDAP